MSKLNEDGMGWDDMQNAHSVMSKYNEQNTWKIKKSNHKGGLCISVSDKLLLRTSIFVLLM